MSDAALIADVLARSPGADLRLWRRIRPLIRAVAAGFRSLDVDDAEQEIMTKVWDRNFRVLRQWQGGEGTLNAYLAAVAKNHCRDRLRSLDRVRRRTPPHVVIDDTMDEIEDPDPVANPAVAALARRIRDCVGMAKRRLAEPQRQLWELRHEEHLMHQEIAARIDKSMGYVGPTLARAERKMCDFLREECPEVLQGLGLYRMAGGG